MAQFDQLTDKHLDALRQEARRRIVELTNDRIAENLSRGLLKENDIENDRAWFTRTTTEAHRLDQEVRRVTIYLPRGKEVEAETFNVPRHPHERIEFSGAATLRFLKGAGLDAAQSLPSRR